MIHTVETLITNAGGFSAVAAACTEKPVTADAVRKWLLNGIPEVHWPVFIEKLGVTAQDIYEANCALRRVRALIRSAPEHRQSAEA